MENKTLIILAVLLIVISSLLLLKNFNSSVVASETTEQLELNLSNLKVCCNYIDEQGKDRSCILQERFDCSLCGEKCS